MCGVHYNVYICILYITFVCIVTTAYGFVKLVGLIMLARFPNHCLYMASISVHYSLIKSL